MQIELWTLGKEDKKEIADAVSIYTKRLKHYTKFSIIYIDNSKINNQLSKEHILNKEAELILSKLSDKDMLITLDETGQELTSVSFANKLNTWFHQSSHKIVFLIGGSYGIAAQLHQRSYFKFSLSQLTFPHQIVRLLFTEQLYRAFTILKNEKYHHE